MSDESIFLTVDMGDDDDEGALLAEGLLAAAPITDAGGVLRIAEPMPLAAEGGRAEEPTISGRGGATAPALDEEAAAAAAGRPARVGPALVPDCPPAAPVLTTDADAAASLAEAASLRRRRAARASWADCFRAAAVAEEVVSDAIVGVYRSNR